jgi:phosphate starvation-inducible protein PhoH
MSKVFPNLNLSGGVDPRIITRGYILGADAREENKSRPLVPAKEIQKATIEAAKKLNVDHKELSTLARAIRKNERKSKSNTRPTKDSNAEAMHEGPQKRKTFSVHDLKNIAPMNDRQREFFYSWGSGQNIIGSGSAGTGKTFLATYLALRDVLDTETPYERIIFVRSTVPVRDMGFLPGDMNEKQAAYEVPYVSIFNELFPWKNAYENMKEAKLVEFMSTSYMRGITFNNAIIIVDELENFNFQEIATISTRVGKNCRIVYCGDTIQSDLLYKKGDVSGMPEFIEMARIYMKSIDIIRFTQQDIVRSGFVKEFLIAREKAGL